MFLAYLEGTVSCFLGAFTIMTPLSSQAKEPVQGSLQLPKVPVPVTRSRDWGDDCQMTGSVDPVPAQSRQS